MIEIVRTDSASAEFVRLVRKLDIELAERDGAEHSYYAQFNKIDMLRYVVVGYFERLPVACGAIKEYNDTTVEVKRMFTLSANRGKGIAARILKELETWATELSFSRCVLETGKKQPEAIALYEKSGYKIIPNYGQYKKMENSMCFAKDL
ncbi:MAG: GNAT family N-acetyltransferase [Acidobacteriota bacterium]